MAETVLGGCGTPSHSQLYGFNGGGDTIACDDCGRPVPGNADVGYYFCNQCHVSSCVSCTSLKQSHPGSFNAPREKKTFNAAQSSRASPGTRTSYKGKISYDSDDDGEENPGMPSVELMAETPIPGGCGTPSHCQYWSRGTGQNIACQDCGRYVPTARVGYYFCSQCYAKSCMSCASLKLQGDAKQSRSRGSPQQQATAAAQRSRGLPQQTVNAAQSSRTSPATRNSYKVNSNPVTPSVESMGRAIRGGCGIPSHVQRYWCNDRTIACEDCSRQVPTAGVGYYFCNQCEVSSCMSCTFVKQGHQSSSNAAPSSRASPLVLASDDDNDDDEKPVLPCAGLLTHSLEFLQKSPYYGNCFGCNMCGEAGYSELYHCESCQFAAHKQCAEVEEEVKVFYHKHPLQRYYTGEDEEDIICQCCQGEVEEDVSPWVYKCPDCTNFAVHARCAKYAKSLTHGSHPHKLKLVHKSSKGKSRQCGCDGCGNEILHTFHYTCTKWGCDFDLHPLCAVLPTKPLCRMNPSHRVEIDYFPLASEQCALCDSPSDEAWLYRCRICDVSMHVDCFSAETDEDSSDDEDDEEDEDLGELYQKFIDSMDDFGNQGNEEKVDKLSELVNSFKSTTEAAAASSLPRQSSGCIRRRQPRSRESDASEEERRRIKQAAKEQRRKEKAAARELQEQEKAARREEKAKREAKVIAELQNIAIQLQKNQNSKDSGGNDATVGQKLAELKAMTENWQASDARRHQEQAKFNEERHLEQTKLHHEQGKLNQERHLHHTKLHHEQLKLQHEQAKLQDKRHLEHTNLLQERNQEYLNGLQEIINTQVQSTTRVVPRLVLCTETSSRVKKLITSLRVGIKVVQLHLFCEHAQQPHVVAGAPGCEINQKVAGDRWTKLQPFLAAGLMVVKLALNFGTTMGAGVGVLKDVLPDLHKMVLETQAIDLGKHAVQPARCKVLPRQEAEEAEVMATQWLVSYLNDQKVNIAESFKLFRVRYTAPEHIKGTVGCLCFNHLDRGMKDGSLEHFPLR
uniref:DC1 domain-containing protein n=1 Tax=Physcomitrium patens TaxID=3218 RepID=A0A7I4BMI4_PHYPA